MMKVTDSARPRTNWAGNHAFTASEILTPASIQEVQEMVRSYARLKALGAGHSFNAAADTSGSQISLRHFNEMSLDRENRTVTVGAGVTYGQLAPWLDAQGFAVHNLASLPHISVVGACATGTHGSGSRNGSLSTAVTALAFVSGAGELVQLSRANDPGIFPGAVVAMGAVGIVTSITLQTVPSFGIAQSVYENLSFNELDRHLEDIAASGYSVSLFTDWQHSRATQVWLKQCAGASIAAPDHFYGATLQGEKLHPLAGHDARNCTEQQGIVGSWYERLPHFRMEFTPSSGAEMQSEYFVPIEYAGAAIRAIETLRDSITPLLFVSEMRTIAADDLWLSMAYRQDSLALHFTWKPDWLAVQRVLPMIEHALAPFSARPHWAKLFTTTPEQLRSLYPMFTEFEALRQRFDPDGRFNNAFLDSIFDA